jgi:hypothetical protein
MSDNNNNSPPPIDHEGFEDVDPLTEQEKERVRREYYHSIKRGPAPGQKPRLVTRIQQDIEMLVEKSKFDEIEEIKYRRPELRKEIDRIINDLYDSHEQRMKEWK